jgi:hypothetical protein
MLMDFRNKEGEYSAVRATNETLKFVTQMFAPPLE